VAEGNAYAAAGVDTAQAAGATAALVSILKTIDPGRPSRQLLDAGHYASVLALGDETAIAICTDGVGTKLIVAEQLGHFDSVGIDCVAMNVNDLICVGARPLALVDYIAVERADATVLEAIGSGLKAGAERAGIEIPGGELAQVPEMIKGHPSPGGLDLVGTAIGTVAPDRIVSGRGISVGDVLLGLPASGLHSNGFTLARWALLDRGGLALDETPTGLDRTLGEMLLEPTEIYVPAILELLESSVPVHGLAHITGDGLLNLLRLNVEAGYEVGEPLPAQAIFGLIAETGEIPEPEMQQVFNMGTGFVCVIPETGAEVALELLRRRYPGAARIGRVTADAGTVLLPKSALVGDREGFRPA
jgi:phosphoribosylformylglycinamidine cyclo-ligase